MRLVALATLALLGSVPVASQNQRLRLPVFGGQSTNQELDSTRNAIGPGVGGSAEFRFGRFAVEVSGYRAELEPDDPALTAYTLQQGDLRVFIRVLNADQGTDLSVLIGGGGRKMDPDLAAVDVGVIRVGVRARAPLTRLAELGIRGAYLAPRFSGGGESSFAFEVGLELGIGTRNGRFRFQAGFDFQRLDRTVGGLDAPVQLTTSRAGVQVAL